MSSILLLEDEMSIRSFISLNLKKANLTVYEAETGEEALELFRAHPDLDIALLDVMLPGIDGFDVCKEIRKKDQRIGIIMLTAKAQEDDKVIGLDTGADDYITKPFSMKELEARISSLLRRIKAIEAVPKQNVISIPPFSLDKNNNTITKNNQLINLTPTEFELIKFLMENENQPISRDQLLDHVWGQSFVGDLKIVDVNIRRIRKKIEDRPSDPKFLKTYWGIGYIWKR
ncbi:response regulator transcription factor [Heyndrickxia vini]|uniref:Response regulator transcription factor n=1 Tax=Heyndrickxia vini TaxID=1476025 RepID=A0ABX7E228_9BACI|nr:response regulator transcription factor [Heyndrickxia vini]QQZ08407.1 response regulator transcription factor [Heyndrickxia vini]